MKQDLKKNTWLLGVVTASDLLLEGMKSVVRRSPIRIGRSYGSLSELHSEVSSGADLAGLVIDASPVEEAEVERLKHTCPGCKIIVLSDAVRCRIEARQCGQYVDGMVLKTSSATVMLKVFELILLGERSFPFAAWEGVRDAPPTPALSENMEVAAAVPPDLHNLSARELEVLKLLSQGDANKLIARELDISDATVKVHVKAILRKTGTRNRTEAALLTRFHLDALEKTAGRAARQIDEDATPGENQAPSASAGTGSDGVLAEGR